MEHDNRAKAEHLKDEVIQEYGVNPEREDLPHDVRRWVELIHHYIAEEELSVGWLKMKTRADISHRFRVKTGFYLIEYIRMLRIELAKKMMEFGIQDLVLIALVCGYRDYSSFCKAFAVYEKFTPSEYRNNSYKNS